MRRLICAVLVSFASTSLASIPASEREALQKIYEALGGPQWQNQQGWLGAPGTECNWGGVDCDAAETTVTVLDLSWRDLRGTIAKEIANLPNLKELRLEGNAITGTLPREIGNLSKLEILRLTGYWDGNELTGAIPSELGQLTNLRELDLIANGFTGGIPTSLATLPNLERLALSYNNLGGSLGEAFLRMPKLETLELVGVGLSGQLGTQYSSSLERIYLSENNLSGPIPETIAQATALQELKLHSNRLSGRLPAALGQLTNLTILELHTNSFEGELPDLGRLAKLTRLWLGRTKLSGPIPSWIGQLRELVEIDVRGTTLGGPLPTELFTLPKLQVFWAEDARFSGRLEDFAALTTLEQLSLRANSFSGPIPRQLSTLANLEVLNLSRMPLGGTIPDELGQLKRLRHLNLHRAALSGPIPSSLGALVELDTLDLDENSLTTLPASFSDLKKLAVLDLSTNHFSGSIPANVLKDLPLRYLDLSMNQFEGEVPPELFTISSLIDLRFARNRLSGAMPPIGALSRLTELDVSENQLTALPPDLGSLVNLRGLWADENRVGGPIPDLSGLRQLQRLDLWSNQFSGPIPNWLGTLTSLTSLDLGYNNLSGVIPSNFLNLTNLGQRYSLGLWYNALLANDPAVKAFVDARDPGWSQTQTVAPANVAVAAQRERSITLSWTPIEYDDDAGGYQIYSSRSPNGPFTLEATTPDKTIPTFILDGLDRATDYYFTVQTVTYPHDAQQNVVKSNLTSPLLGRTTTGVPSPANLIVLSTPDGMFQRTGASAATDGFVLFNLGDLPSTVTLTREGTFFSVDPTSVAIAGNSSTRIGLTSTAQPIGAYEGRVLISGQGVPAGTAVPVRLLVSDPPTGTVRAEPNVNRIDVAAIVTENPTGSVVFRNTGSATLRGIVVSNVAWIIPPTGLITINVGESKEVTFTVDRAKRPDSASPAGAVVGTLSLIYDSGAPAGKLGELNGGSVKTTTPVTIVDTVKPPITSLQVPPLAAGEVALVVPGAGRVFGNNRLYLSDVSIVNAYGVDVLRDLKMYFTPNDPSLGSAVADVAALPPSQSVSYANVVQSVFNGDGVQGTLQIRTRSPERIAVNANIFAVNDPKGTFGTSIPVFRSDQALAPGESIFLTGLPRTAERSTYTNILVQEMSGGTASYEITFHDANGNAIGSKLGGSIAPFRLARHNDGVPVGGVAARVTNLSTSGGRIVAYATPVDNASNDFWTVVDWNREFGSTLEEPAIIPVVGTTLGANAYFRSDVAMTNRSASEGRGVFTYYDRGGAVRQRELTFTPGQSVIYSDVIGTLFPDLTSAIGYIEFVPSSGSFSITSRTFASVPGLTGTYGTGVPTVPRSFAIRAGQSKTISGLEVSSEATISDHKPGTFRTNLGFVEITGKSVKVEVTVTYADIKQVVYATRIVRLPYTIAGHELRLDSNFAASIKQANPFVSDLRNVQLTFKVVEGDGAVVVFTTSVDNGTADQILRTK